jgi:hypothetical protein
MVRYCLIVLFCNSILHFNTSAQDSSYLGTEFWVGYGHHQFMESGQTNSQEMILYFSAIQPANVTVSIVGTSWIRNYVVPANSAMGSELIPKYGMVDARLISLPCQFVLPGYPCGGEGVFSNKGIHIQSDVPIAAYSHIYGSASSGASMLMPVSTWGYDYKSLNSKQSYASNCFSWTYAVAQHDSTVIEVTPITTSRTGKAANVPDTITLQKGWIYQLMAGPETGFVKPEMTGTRVRSLANESGDTYPIAVFSGSSRTSTLATCGTGGGDNDMVQVFPLHTWGKEYLTAPLAASNNAATLTTSMFKVMVHDSTTIVTRNGVLLTGLIDGNYYLYESNTPDRISADKPILVAQFMLGGGTCLVTGVGDPDMYYLSPLEARIKQASSMRSIQEEITVNLVTIIIPTAGLSSLLIDGIPAYDTAYAHPNKPGYSVVVKIWSPSSDTQISISSDSAFTGLAYGKGTVESYGFNIGLNMKQNNGADYNVPLLWRGVASSDWFEKSNWSSGNIPTEIDYVKVPAGTAFSPALEPGQVGTCKGIRLEPGANINVKGNARLNVTGKE